MKNSLLLGTLVILIITSCEKISNEAFLLIGSGQKYTFNDFELYDTSTHILYFKKPQDYFGQMYENTFTFLDNGVIIYQGSFVPGYSSTIPHDPFIMSPPGYGNYALRIENWHSDKHDIRKYPKMIGILNQHGLLHSGLSISSGSLVINGTQLIFNFTITNQDQSGLFIIDLEKTGPNLFHFFTNGLYIYDLSHNEVFSSTIQHQAPVPWNSWEMEWLSELKSGESKEYSITYSMNNPLSPGEYQATFKFPGLKFQVKKDQLYQGNSRIWLGDISLRKMVTVQ